MRLTSVLVIGALAGCAMPRSVTSLSEVQNSAEQGQIRLIPISAATLPALPEPIGDSFPAAFSEAKDYAYDNLGPGDRLHVTIWETTSPAVFSSAGGLADLGEMSVDEKGRIYIPYVGPVQATGLSAPEVRDSIIAKLGRVVHRPQVDVRVVERRSNRVSVLGAAGKSGSYSLERGQTRLSQLLAVAAPNQENPEMLAVTLRRSGTSSSVRLSDIYAKPKLDIALRPGDSIILKEMVQNITVLGAAGVQGQVRIRERDFTLIEALGQARGLNPEAADPRGVFVMRAQDAEGAPPLVYQFDMRRPDAIALANRFVVKDNDAVLISSAPWAQTKQVLSAFAQSLSPFRAAATMPIP